jgi:hypothetical protein
MSGNSGASLLVAAMKSKDIHFTKIAKPSLPQP